MHEITNVENYNILIKCSTQYLGNVHSTTEQGEGEIKAEFKSLPSSHPALLLQFSFQLLPYLSQFLILVVESFPSSLRLLVGLILRQEASSMLVATLSL